MEPRYAIRDILDISAGNFVPGHLPDTECNPGGAQAVSSIRPKRHRSSCAYNGKSPVIKDAVNHAYNTVFIRDHPHIRLGCRFPCCFITGSDAGFQERTEGRIDTRVYRQHLIPDYVWFKMAAEMIGYLFADQIPFRFRKGMTLFIIEPDWTRIHPYDIRNRCMFLKSCQDCSSCKRGESKGLYFIKFSRGKSDQGTGFSIANLFHPSKIKTDHHDRTGNIC